MISLVITTKNRSMELSKALDSFVNQTESDFEIICIDQSENTDTESVVERFKSKLKITYIRQSSSGASRGRNLGLSHVKGDVVGFPDDDCWYPEDLIKNISFIFKKEQLDILTFKLVDPTLNNKPITTFLSDTQYVNKKNVWHGGVAAGLFVKSSLAKKLKFDEELGVGSGTPYGSGEETDFLLRALVAGSKILYKNDLFAYHPLKDINIPEQIIGRMYSYGVGLGRVVRKNNLGIFFTLKIFIRPLGGALLSLLKFNLLKSKSYIASFSGRVRGYFF